MNKRLLILLLITTCILHLNACSESTTIRNSNTNFNDESTSNSSAITVDSNQYSPKIFFVGNDEVVLTESSLVADFPIGVWAVFVKENDGYKLRAIIELI